MTIELDTTLAQAEVLFLSFQQLVSDIDRRRAESAPGPVVAELRRRGSGKSPAQTASPNINGNREEGSSANRVSVSLPLISDNLREMLVNGNGR